MKQIGIDYTSIAANLRPTKLELKRMQDISQEAVNILNKHLESIDGITKIKVIGSVATGFILRGTRDIDIIIHFENFNKREFRSCILTIPEFSKVKFSENNMYVIDKFNCKFMTMDLSCGIIIGDLSPEHSLQADIFHHPDFWNNNSPPSIDDVLLCKQFFKILGLYGTHIGGFAVELLVSHFGTFFKTLEYFSNQSFVKIDYSGRYIFENKFIEISYPYSGLANLVRDINEVEAKCIREYACEVILNPYCFKVDSQRSLTNNFWKRRFQKYGNEESFGMPDIYLSRKEEHELKKHISRYPCEQILDAGCGNGFSTIQINKNGQYSTVGIDIYEPSIVLANKKAEGYERINFIQGCLTQLPFSSNTFDVVYAKRSLSNLPCLEAQKVALDELCRVVRKGGILLVHDLFREGFERLNSIRCRWNLPLIQIPYHIIPLEHTVVQKYFSNKKGTMRYTDKTSAYYYFTRIVFMRLSQCLNFELSSSSFLHKIAALLPSRGNLGINSLYIYEKHTND